MSGRHRTDHQTQLAWVIDFLPVHRRDYIAGFDPRFCRRSVWFNLTHKRTGLLPFELHRVGYLRGEGLHRGADIPAHDATFVTQTLHHLTRQIRGNSEADPWFPPLRLKIAVLIPSSRPSVSTSAPPELPMLIAASVWMKFS